ncbi:MAG TPA: adenylate/guanylate cyclase domain-containing protein, partial [Ilumatobacteraceae bacterium]|nr:adenylate/guanylate cyclase domain-containing protein [Ilumatobacteraceae bacterium]
MRTLLFSDIEGSTSLLDRAGPKYRDMLAVHRRIVRAAVESAGGTEHSTEGDSFFLSFDSPTAAIAAAVASQRAMEAHEWPDGLRMRVRMGVHAGEVQETDDDDLLGMSINHAARIAAAAHGGQIVLSEAVRQMAHQLPEGVQVRSLGTHRLRDVGSITLFQVEHPDLQHDFPPPRGAIGYRTNLPRIRTPFVGGDRLLEAIGEHLDAANLVTLTGTGGVGKTRAAVEYGLSRLDDLDQGVFFVDLAPVSDTGAVIGAIASTLPIIAGGDQLLLETVVDWIAERRLLFIIDNCEHL